MAVPWLRLCVSTAKGSGSIPGQGTKIPHASWCGQKKEKEIHFPASLAASVVALTSISQMQAQGSDAAEVLGRLSVDGFVGETARV